MRRLEFIASLGSLPLAAFAQNAQNDQSDPALQSSAQLLRVLLGIGDARAIDARSFLFAGRRYRGTFTYEPDTHEVINTVPLEEYLYSVVPREMPRSWPAGALDAQAIAARTYVLQRSNPAKAYDLVPSEADQVYTGTDAESAATTAAVDSTTGLVLRFGGGFAQIAYSSCCGGHTESSASAWDGAPVAYLAGVICTYCTGSPWYRWTRAVPMQHFSAALASKTAALGRIQAVTLDAPDVSGRPHFWAFEGDAGTLEIKASEVRRELGARTLPSLLVQSVQLPGAGENDVRIAGGGLGHGVGLCQWGARGMALGGADAGAILALYFPGTQIGHD